MKDQEGARVSAVHAKQKVCDWLGEQTGNGKKPSTVDFRGAYPKGDSKRVEFKSQSVGKPKQMKKAPEIVDNESESSVTVAKPITGPGKMLVGSREVAAGRIMRKQLAARKAVSQYLPKFRGEAEVWPMFISSFEHTICKLGEFEATASRLPERRCA